MADFSGIEAISKNINAQMIVVIPDSTEFRISEILK
jgi:hypothetical protein